MDAANSLEKSALPVDDLKRLAPLATHPGMNRVLFLLSLSYLINYIDRSNLSIAAPLIKDELSISASQLGALLSAFFWTYACLQIPAGWLADRFDVKWILAIGFFLWSMATAVTRVLHGCVGLIVIRVILGAGESVAVPSCTKILGSHFNERHRGFATSAVMAGLALGPAVGMLVGGNVVGLFGWRPFFVTLGLIGLLWLVPWWAWMPNRKASPAETTKRKAGFHDILRQRSAWGTCIGLFCLNYTLSVFEGDMATVLSSARSESFDDSDGKNRGGDFPDLCHLVAAFWEAFRPVDCCRRLSGLA